MRKQFVILVFIIICSCPAFAQDIKADIISTTKFYEEAQSLSMKMNYRFYADKTSTEVLEEYSGTYKTFGKYFFSDMLGVLSVQDSKLKIYVDKTAKIVMVSNTDTATHKSFSIGDLDKLLKIYSSVDYLGIQGNNKVYTYNYLPNKTEYDAIKIYIDKGQDYITKVVFYYNKNNNYYKANEQYPNPRLEVTYSDVIRNKAASATDFNTTKYVTAANGKYSLSAQYKNYQLINAIPR